MELRKNEVVKGVITDLNDDGQGVLKSGENIIFIPNTIPNEEIEAIVIKTFSKYCVAKTLNFIKPDKNRKEPACPYFSKCGGCDIMHLPESSQVDFKTTKVERALKRVANINYSVNKCISLNNLRYRNKIALPISPSGEVGLYRKNTHNILPICDCMITEEWNKLLIECVNEYIKLSGISIYNEETRTGILKHVVARSINNEILITLVINGDKIPKQDMLIDQLSKHFNNFGLNLNINKEHNNVILSNKWKHLYGIQNLTITEFDITHPISNASFYQINNQIKHAIYSAVLDFIPNDYIVIDAYSGAGLLSGIISKKAKTCYGVEIVKEATENANELKKQNNLTNLININGDCTKELPRLISQLKNEHIIVTLDPPRKGCDKKVLDAIINTNCDKIIYISCDPNSLARDLKIVLESNKYEISSIQPYDMFPNTKHVETLAVLSHK